MREYDVVRLDCDLRDLLDEGLEKGEEGTIVQVLAPDALLVEFSDEHGVTRALSVLQRHHLTVIWQDETDTTEAH